MRDELRELKPYLLIGFVNGVAMGIRWSIYAPYLRLLGYSATLYGLIAGSGVVVSAFSTLFAGILVDVRGAKRIALYGLSMNTIIYFLIYLGHLWSLVLASLIDGLASGFYYTAYTVLVSKSMVRHRLHYAYSFTASLSIMGDAIGLYLGWIPVLLNRYMGLDLLLGYKYMILTPPILVILALMMLTRIEEHVIGRERGAKSIMDLFREYKHLPRGLLILLVSNAIIGFGAAMSIHNIDYYFSLKYHTTSGELGSVLGTQQLIMALLMLRLPRLVERVGDIVKTYLLITSPSIPLLIAMTYTNSFVVAGIIYISRSILMNLANPLYNALSMQITPEHLRGRVASILSLPWTLLGGVARGIGGRLMDLDVELPLRITAVLYTIGLAVMGVYFRRGRR